jgi:hypothetical protein
MHRRVVASVAGPDEGGGYELRIHGPDGTAALEDAVA